MDPHINAGFIPIWAGQQQAYPRDAPVLLTSGTGAWVMGALTEIIPASTVSSVFDIHWCIVSNISQNADFTVDFYYGPSALFAGTALFTRSQVQNVSLSVPAYLGSTEKCAFQAGTRIQAQMMDSTGGGTAYIRLLYQ